MRKFLVILLATVFLSEPVFCALFEGGVEKTGMGTSSVILDAETNLPVEDVKITLPKQNYTTRTDKNGAFNLGVKLNSPTILSMEKEGYRPYSITVDKSITDKPIVVSIEKSGADDVVVTNGWHHLGDNSFSPNSANCSEFHEQASGAYYSKNFNIASSALASRYILIVGSIIGIDSLMAQKMGQNNVKTSYASPPEIYLNGIKIANIELNGDAQRFELPKNLVRRGMENEITIKTGKNMTQTSHVDYDDIEFMNLSIITEK